ncbi:MAG: AAA family ATPase [Bacteroidota bacterium]
MPELLQNKIKEAIGDDGKLLTDVIPNLELIIGEQPETPELGGEESKKRFNYVFKNFVQSLASEKHPLVLFVDDLQWADFASLRLIEELILDGDVKYFFLVGAYRSNEVRSSHPLTISIDRIQKENKHLEELDIHDLNIDDLYDLISDTLNSKEEKIQHLAEVVYSKTKGNAFFTNQFLKTLYEKEVLSIDQSTYSKEENLGTWKWNIDEIRKLNITDNVVELMSDKVQDLSTEAQETLKTASCIGNRFDLHTLSIILKKSARDTASHLWEALEEGLVVPVNDNYKTFNLEEGEQEIVLSKVEYQFVHDRVQQAAYSLIPETDKKAVHSTIGRLLFDNVDLDKQDNQLFDVVNQLNKGISKKSSKESKFDLAELNLRAGKKAKASTAYQPAYKYLKTGLELVPKDIWKSNYDFALSLYTETSEVAFLSGEFEEMRGFIREVAGKAESVLDKISAYKISIQACIAQNQSAEAINIARSVIKELKVKLPDEPGKKHIVAGLVKTSLLLKRKSFEDLENLPEMTDPYALAFLDIAASVGSAISRTTPQLLPLIIFKQIQLSIKHGNSIQAIPAYSGYGIIQCGILGNIENGYQFGQLAFRIKLF